MKSKHNQTTFAERLKFQRITHALTQQELAKQVRVSQVSVSNWERGAKEPNFSILVQLVKIFGVSSDYFLGMTDTYEVK